MARRTYCGIDIGTSQVKVVVAAPSDNPDLPMNILGTGTASSKGMRHGYVVDTKEVVKSVREALQRASQASKVRITKARVAMGGVGLDEMRSTGEVTLTASGGIVTDRDIERALKESEKRAAAKLSNRIVIHTIPLEYRVDGAKIFGQKPQGLQGTKLSVDTLLITMLSQQRDDIIQATEAAGVEVEGEMASPLASSLVTLNKAQKTAGVVLANIGAETLSVVVFDNNVPISIKIFPKGSADVTNTIALLFQIPLSEAESLKRGGVTGSDIPAKKMQTIITTQLKEMFTTVGTHLKSINRNRLLPAGIVLTGGGSGFQGAAETARSILKLPSAVGQIGIQGRTSSVDQSWSVAYGLCRWAYGEDMGGSKMAFSEIAGNFFDTVKQLLRSLMP